MTRPSVLLIISSHPNENGTGANQRAANLLGGLNQVADVDIVHLKRNFALAAGPVGPAIAGARSFTVCTFDFAYCISEKFRWLPWSIGSWIDYVRFGASDLPKVPRLALEKIAASFSQREYDCIIAVRLANAVVTDQLIAAKHVKGRRLAVDIDDFMSVVKQRELEAQGETASVPWRMLQKRIVDRIARAEQQIAATWDIAAVCSELDADRLRRMNAKAEILVLPNVVNRPLLPQSDPACMRVLFIGALHYNPNVEGLRAFLKTAWPIIRTRMPQAELVVVGIAPSEELRAEVVQAGGALFANVPAVEPYYADCAVTICPLLNGGGTRVKLVEAMAFGRPIVSTTIGAEGLDIVAGEHALIADDMAEFAEATMQLLTDNDLRRRLVAKAHALYDSRYSLASMQEKTARLLG